MIKNYEEVGDEQVVEKGGEMKRSGAKILSERSADDQSVLGSSSKGWGATAAG